jgi:competence protein ComEC
VTAVALWKEVLRVGSFEVTFFDVGQGDAAFILTPQGHQIVIDGGSSKAILEKLSQKIPFWDKTIDMVILSHPAQDHVAGLLDVLQKYRVKTIMWTGVEKDTKIFQEWKKAVDKEQEEGATISFATGRETISFQEGSCPQRMDILFPLKDLRGKLVEDDNDTSIVVRLYSCTHAVLFMGDLTVKGERVLLSRYAGSRAAGEEHVPLDSDILKVGHHGSKTSSSEEFINVVNPDVAVISAGAKNRYGHPHQETLATFVQYGIEIRRTDEEGDISFRFK